MPGLEDYHWYPPVHFDYSTSPYGPPQEKTIELLINRLPPNSEIGDVAGGYGRYAEPLAVAGHNVTILDIDPPHMEEARRRAAALPEGSGRIDVVEADIVEGDLDHIGPFDAILCTGFLYLAPREVIRGAFHRMVGLLKGGGLSVVEFATNRERYDADGNLLVGADEQNYTYRQGLALLRQLNRQERLIDTQFDSAVFDLQHPYRFHADIIIASGVKPE